jgi:uncharacterized membrane protein YbjE (DUF340 family)
MTFLRISPLMRSSAPAIGAGWVSLGEALLAPSVGVEAGLRASIPLPGLGI